MPTVTCFKVRTSTWKQDFTLRFIYCPNSSHATLPDSQRNRQSLGHVAEDKTRKAKAKHV